MRPLLGESPAAIKAMAHITGGGITDNLPRVLPDGLGAEVALESWEVPPIFQWLQRAGGVPQEEMFRTFNMGIGLILIVAPGDADRVLVTLRESNEAGARIVGVVRPAAGPRVRYTSGV